MSVLQLRSDVVPKTAGMYTDSFSVWTHTTARAGALLARWGRAVGETWTGNLRNQFWRWNSESLMNRGSGKLFFFFFCATVSAITSSCSVDLRLSSWLWFWNQYFVTWVRFIKWLSSSRRKLPCLVHWREGLWLCGQLVSQNHPWVHVPGKVKAIVCT